MRWLLTAVLLALAAPASAATLPAGTYDARLTGGSLEIGTLPAIPIGSAPPSTIVVPEGAPGEVTLPADGVAIPPSIINVPCFPGPTCPVTLTVVLTGPVTAGIDPATGAAHASGSAYATLSGDLGLLGVVDCSIGTALAPVTLNLDTAPPGSAWDSVTGALTVVDDTFALPAISCTNAGLNGLIGGLLGPTGVGNNLLSLNWLITQRPASTTPPPPPPPAVTPPAPPPPPPAGPAATVPTELKVVGSRVRLDRRGFARIRVTCVRAAVRCAGTLVLTARKLRLGSGKFRLAPGKSQLVRVKVSKKGRALIKKRSLKSTATLTAPGMTKKLTKRLTLVPPKKS